MKLFTFVLSMLLGMTNAHSAQVFLSKEPANTTAMYFVGAVNTNGDIYACSPKGHVRNLAALYGRKLDDKQICDTGSGYWVEPSFLVPPNAKIVGYRVLGNDNYIGRGGTRFVLYFE